MPNNEIKMFFFFSDIYDLLFHFNRIKMVIFSNIYDLLFHHIKFDKIMHIYMISIPQRELLKQIILVLFGFFNCFIF